MKILYYVLLEFKILGFLCSVKKILLLSLELHAASLKTITRTKKTNKSSIVTL